jgi:hypothetical protein
MGTHLKTTITAIAALLGTALSGFMKDQIQAWLKGKFKVG